MPIKCENVGSWKLLIHSQNREIFYDALQSLVQCFFLTQSLKVLDFQTRVSSSGQVLNFIIHDPKQYPTRGVPPIPAGLKVNDQLVAYATRFSAVRLKNHEQSHHRAFKATVQCDLSIAYSPDHSNVLRHIT